MDSYIEVTVRPDPEFSTPILMGALFNKLHWALTRLESNDVGVSFPGYQKRPRSLGQVLRVHGSAHRLQQLAQSAWLQGMTDHVSVKDVLPAPSSVEQVIVKRRQFKTNAERLRRRRMKRKHESYKQSLHAIPDTVERKPDLPYVTLRSQSTGQPFQLFIDQVVWPESSRGGQFNCYGLSQTATVPWF